MSDTTRFLAYLRAACVGRASAQTAAALQVATGITPRRQQAIILELEAQGVDVCSACDRKPFGYYLPASDAERAAFLHQLRERRNALASRITGLEARHPGLRETTKRTPGLRIEPTGEPRQSQLQLSEVIA